mmetsp:Transcript_60680/g.146024  ORF Transcript_60680/g.146024 Transcript_60680/m.146024 type:complete len:274 (-) Transcript_60680:2175-2996(-)
MTSIAMTLSHATLAGCVGCSNHRFLHSSRSACFILASSMSLSSSRSSTGASTCTASLTWCRLLAARTSKPGRGCAALSAAVAAASAPGASAALWKGELGSFSRSSCACSAASALAALLNAVSVGPLLSCRFNDLDLAGGGGVGGCEPPGEPGGEGGAVPEWVGGGSQPAARAAAIHAAFSVGERMLSRSAEGEVASGVLRLVPVPCRGEGETTPELICGAPAGEQSESAFTAKCLSASCRHRPCVWSSSPSSSSSADSSGRASESSSTASRLR